MTIDIFNDPNQVPQPRDEIRIEEVVATPYPDRHRVHVDLKITPFQERPNLLLVVRDAQQRVISELDVIATMHAHMEFTIHIRNVEDPAGEYNLYIELFYETRKPPQDTYSGTFTIPAESDN